MPPLPAVGCSVPPGGVSSEELLVPHAELKATSSPQAKCFQKFFTYPLPNSVLPYQWLDGATSDSKRPTFRVLHRYRGGASGRGTVDGCRAGRTGFFGTF